MNTPEQNKTTLEAANAANAVGDYEGFLLHCTADTKWSFVGDRTLTGKDAVRQYMLSTYKEPPQFSVSEMIAERDFVIAIGKITLEDEVNTRTEFSYCDIWRFRDGKIAELTAFVIKG